MDGLSGSTQSLQFYNNRTATESMRIASTGNVGIGTSSPATRLEVKSGGSVNLKVSTDSNAFSYLTLNTWALDRAQIRAEAANPGAGSGTGSGALSFWVAQNPTMTEAMRIDSSGNLGIGSASPVGRLDVYTAAGGTSYFRDATVQTYIGTNTANGFLGTGTNHPFSFLTNNSERMRIDSSGNVGIGTSSPSAKLQVNQTTSAGAGITMVGSSANTGLTSDFGSLSLQNTNTTNNNYNTLGFVNDQGGFSSAIYGIYTDHTSGSQSGALAFGTRNAGSFAERMRITSAGILQFDSGYGSVATAYGCRAWVNFNGTGTVAIRASGNVSSITDNSTGNYTVNFTTALADANYCLTGMGINETGAQAVLRENATAQTTTACRIRLEQPGVAVGDGSQVNVAFFR